MTPQDGRAVIPCSDRGSSVFYSSSSPDLSLKGEEKKVASSPDLSLKGEE